VKSLAVWSSVHIPEKFGNWAKAGSAEKITVTVTTLVTNEFTVIPSHSILLVQCELPDHLSLGNLHIRTSTPVDEILTECLFTFFDLFYYRDNFSS
jgi:hypothetical protein